MRIDESYYTRPEGMPESVSAGGVVARLEGDQILIAAAHEQDLNDPVLPKGHVEAGEELEDAARREIAEEVGLQKLTLLEKLGSPERLSYAKTEWKITHYFLYLTEETVAVPLEKEVHTTMSWMPLDPTPAFFWPEQRALIDDHHDRIVQLVQDAAREESHA